MPFLRKKKGSKSIVTDPSNPNSNAVPVTVNESAPFKETKSKFGRKKKNNAADTLSSKSSEQSQATHESNNSIGPLGANSVSSKRLSFPQQTAPQSRGNSQKNSNATVTSHTITTASTSNTSTNQSNSSVSALFSHSKTGRTNALQQRQLSHMKRVGGVNGGGVSPISKDGMGRPSQPRSQPQNATGRQQAQSPQTDLFSSQGMPEKNAMPAAAMPMTRSGWSMVSNASTAMNSVQYIESLDNLPCSPGIRGKVSVAPEKCATFSLVGEICLHNTYILNNFCIVCSNFLC